MTTLLPGILLALGFHPICAAEPETSSSSSSENTPETTAAKKQNNPQIIMSVPPEWGKAYKQEMGKAAVYDVHEKKGNDYLTEGKYDLAVSEFNAALQLAGKTDIIGIMSAHRNLAKTYEAMAKYPDAIAHIQFLIEHTQSDIARNDYMRWKEAIEAANRGEFSQAAQIYETILTKAEDWERPQIQQRLDAMQMRTRATPHVHANNVTAEASLITDYILSEFEKRNGIDLRNVREAYERVREAAEKASSQLQTLEEAEVDIPFVTADASGPKHINMTVKREDLRKFASGKTE